jgi:hypothetical protein
MFTEAIMYLLPVGVNAALGIIKTSTQTIALVFNIPLAV